MALIEGPAAEPRRITSRRVVTPEGLRPATVHLEQGRITAVSEPSADRRDPNAFDLGELVVAPGLVDTHVHVNEPGRTDWEGFETATRAAAAGGVTTLVDMPLNSVPATTTPEALDAKRRAAAGKCHVDVGFWGGVVPGNESEVAALADAGVLGFKAFLVDSGVAEFPASTLEDLRSALPPLAESGLPLLVHAEDPDFVAAPPSSYPKATSALQSPTTPPLSDDRRSTTSYLAYLKSRPPAAELSAIGSLLGLCRETPFRLHVVHLATPAALPLFDEARAEGLPVTVETCPHYLTFAAEEIPDGDTRFKCAPPIREAAAREGLWSALLAGRIDLVATDHSPCPPELRELETGDFLAAWGGIASLQFLLPAVWTAGRKRGATIEQLARWLAAAPARLAGLTDRKGALVPGTDADLVAWDPDGSFVVDAGRLHHRHPVTPYDGRRLAGVVRATWVRGRLVYADGRFPGPPGGELLTP